MHALPLAAWRLHPRDGTDVLLVSSADETANDVYDVLAGDGLLADGDARPQARFVTSGDPGAFSAPRPAIPGPEFLRARRVELEPARSV